RRRELAELMSDHVLRHDHRHVLTAVVHGNRQTDEVRRDRRTARPSLDRLLAALGLRLLDFLREMQVDERAFAYGTWHGSSLLLAPVHDHAIGALVMARLVTLGRRAPGAHRMASALGAAFTAAVRVVD